MDILTKWDYLGMSNSEHSDHFPIQSNFFPCWLKFWPQNWIQTRDIFDIPYHIFAAVLKVIIMVAVKIKMTSWVDRFAVPEPKLNVTTPRILLPPVVDDDPMRTILTICNYTLQFIHARWARIKGSLRSTNWMSFQNKHLRSNNLLQICWRLKL